MPSRLAFVLLTRPTVVPGPDQGQRRYMTCAHQGPPCPHLVCPTWRYRLSLIRSPAPPDLAEEGSEEGSSDGGEDEEPLRPSKGRSKSVSQAKPEAGKRRGQAEGPRSVSVRFSIEPKAAPASVTCKRSRAGCRGELSAIGA